MDELAIAVTENRSILTGTIVAFEPDGSILVRPASSESPVPSYFLQTSQAAPPRLEVGDTVLLAFDEDRARGYVLGIVAPYSAPAENDRIETEDASGGVVEISLPRNADAVRMKGKKIYIEAGEEIRLTCGGGTIMIDKRGKIVVRGTDIVSRARRSNKVKGASVAIN